MTKQQKDTFIKNIAEMAIPASIIPLAGDDYSIRVDRSDEAQYCVIKVYTPQHRKYNVLSSINAVWSYPKTAKGVFTAAMRYQKEEQN